MKLLKIGTWLVHLLSDNEISEHTIDEIINKISIKTCDESVELFKKSFASKNDVIRITSKCIITEIGNAIYNVITKEEENNNIINLVLKKIAEMGVVGKDAALWWLNIKKSEIKGSKFV